MSTPPADSLDTFELLDTDYDSPLAQELVAEVQQEYVVRYGGPDGAPMDAAQFAPPSGAFFVALVDGTPVGTAGLRRWDASTVELKRLYVRAAHRRRGHARRLLAAVERRARDAGYARLVLETGGAQPEAVALYRATGYTSTAPFGHYADSPQSIHLAKEL